MTAKKRDFLDEIIDIQQDWNALSRSGDEIVERFTADPNDVPVFDPDDYKERPRVNSTLCVSAASRNASACTRCVDVCPDSAITINGATVRIDDDCRRCCLCAAQCPTEAFMLRKYVPTELYNTIARMAAAHEQCYITCARALGRLPKANELVLPCVGALAREVWFDLLCDYPNLSVYLPLGACDDCRVTTGEEVLGTEIATAEQWSGESVGLEIDESDLVHEQSRAYKRSQFVSSVTSAGTRLVTRGNPMLAGAQAVANRISNHTKQINELQRTLEGAVGVQNAQNRHRILTRRRKLLMAGLQKYPDLADEMVLSFPHIDASMCTMCEDCVKACTLHALEMDKSGCVRLEPTCCTNCGACARVCAEGAITMKERDAAELVVPDEKAERRRRERSRAREAAKKKLNKGLDFLESLDKDE